MIDFGVCVFRRNCTDVNNWRSWAASVDSEGVVGRAMQKYLDGDFVYRQSDLSKKLDYDYRREGC